MGSLHLTPPAPPRLNRLARAFWHQHLQLWRHVCRRWYVYALALLLGAVASHWIGLNFTNSVPERLVWLEHGAAPQRGDLIVFRFKAEQGATAKLSGTRWLKRVAGVPGDVITVDGRTVYLNGQLIGNAIERTPRGSVMTVVEPGVVPEGHYFIGGSTRDSLDSRYRDVGLVKREQVIARAHRIF
jgi:conjugal transfer pilin signal peptidase TrbI